MLFAVRVVYLAGYVKVSFYASGTRSLLARSDELKSEAVSALEHVIRLQCGE